MKQQMTQKQLPLEWTKHLRSKAERDTFESLLRNNTNILFTLYCLIEEYDNAIQNKDYSETDFETPNWSEKQAFRNGQKSTLNKIKKLLEFSKAWPKTYLTKKMIY